MRLLATLLVLLAAIYLHLRVVQKDTVDNIFYYNNGYTPKPEAYVKLLEELRSRLANGTDAHGIPVTRPLENIPPKERFVQVVLDNGGETPYDHWNITVIIDTVNVYVVGYLNGTSPSTLYFFKDSPRDELLEAFPGPQYTHRRLPFDGNYQSLPDRKTHELGHGALNEAIKNLYYGKCKPEALLVIIQMVAEAVRIRYIEHLILRNMRGKYKNFIPDFRAICMENQWSKLSNQIQLSGKSGVFNRTILVPSVLNETIKISNVQHIMSQAALALMLYRSNPKPCPHVEPTTNIIGRDGQCVDVKDNQYNNSSDIILWPCGNALRNQLWTFKYDGTIRSNGKCLATDGKRIMISDCDKDVPEATKWILYNAGTIMNPKSGLVISAETSTQGTVLTVAEDNNSSRQAWSAGNYTQLTKNYISGFLEMCLQANGANKRVWLENCVIPAKHTDPTEPRQHWALYGDGTIRRYRDRNLCVTSNRSHKSYNIVILLKCQGSENQRWTFMADGTILNPNARQVMDVLDSNVSLQYIILYPPTGNPNQKWLAF